MNRYAHRLSFLRAVRPPVSSGDVAPHNWQALLVNAVGELIEEVDVLREAQIRWDWP